MKRSSIILTTIAVLGCGAEPTLTSPERGVESAIVDGRSANGNASFYFLPPIAQPTSYSGVFDAGLQPVVKIEAEGEPTISLTPTAVDGAYQVDWHTNEYDLDPSKTYRIWVAAQGFALGFADVQVGATGADLRNVNTGEYVPLKDGRTLPIRFRIEEGIYDRSGPVAWYPFEGSVEDQSGNGNHYTNQGAVFAADRNGTELSAMSFPAFGSQLARDWPDFPAQSFSVSLWVKMEGQFDYNSFSYFEWGDQYRMSSGNPGIKIGLDANWSHPGRACASPSEGYVMYAYHGGGSLAWESDGCTPYEVFAEWNHVAVTSEGGVATVYWNGVALGTLDYTVPLPTNGTMSWVGNPDNNNNPLPTRFVDDLGVWDRVLADWEVAYLAGR